MPTNGCLKSESRSFKRYNHVRFEKPHPIIIRPLDPKIVITLFLLTLIPLTKVLFPFWTYFEPTPFEEVDSIEQISPDVKFLVEPDVTKTVKMLVMVNSQAIEKDLRKGIRKSWGNSSFYDSTMTKIVFVFGKPETDEELDTLNEENLKHNDILVTDVAEDYYALTLKTHAMMVYQVERVPRAKCLVKADSDNVLHLFNFELLCEETKAPLILGNCNVDRRVLRKNSKWSIPYDLYDKPRWPRYCSTGTYVLCGRDVPRRIIEASRKTKFFSSVNYRRLPEDVLFTGVFPQMAGIQRKTAEGFTFRDQPKYKCRDIKFTHSIHMHRRKDPVWYYKRMRSLEGGFCLM